MSGDDLRVTEGHLRDLAAHQRQASTMIRVTTAMTAGVDAAVQRTHGSIAQATARALATVQAARGTAAECLAGASEGLGAHLITAAVRYGRTDQAARGVLDAQLGPKRS